MFLENIKQLANENENFREVVYTGSFSQLVLMSIPAGEEIGEEVHRSVDQLLFLVRGQAEAIIDRVAYDFQEHDVLFVPAGTKHNIINVGDEDLKLYTVYAPSEHPDKLVNKTKTAAAEYEDQKDKD